MLNEKTQLMYTVVRSRRRTVGLQINRDGELVVRAPLRAAQKDIDRFIEQKAEWVRKTQARVLAEAEAAKACPTLSCSELQELAAKAAVFIPERVKYYAPRVGVSYGRITIRSQRTRWGSCSTKGNLNFNCLLMLAPPEVLDSVVVHELCHRKQMNHSDRFYAEVLRVLPAYHEYDRWLKLNGRALLNRLPK